MPDATKAAHYIQQLDDARCDDNWDAVPELVRKVRKHAPDRICLALTAEIEHSIAKASLEAPAPSAHAHATDSTSSVPGLDAASLLPGLLTAIDSETQHPQDRFQAHVCAGWLLWVLREYAGALARLPHALLDNDGSPETKPGSDGQSEWTRVCALKAAYLRANCLARDGHREGALHAFETALPSLAAVWAAGPAEARQQMRYWAELFLTEYCMLASQALRDGVRSLREPDCLACFRAWARYWAAGNPAAGVPGGVGFRGSVPRRQVWAEYYFTLSEILQGDLPFPTGYGAADAEGSGRSQLRAELKKAEAIYQGLLFIETKFPKADEERAEVEGFVHRMMDNWAISNGRGWKEHDLGAGGRDSLCRGTLDSLYGAAAKTYHSTAILRHLFTVHLAVAEFDLAFMAFDSWFELVKKGKARVRKTHHAEPALDDDATMFATIAACIAALCRYGGREAAEKGWKLAEELEDLVEKPENGDADGTTPHDEVPPSILALAWQSIGLAHAQWARMTYESESRASIQEKAIQCLRRSLSPRFGQPFDVRGVFALGILYAEQHKLSAAIELVKTALLGDKTPRENQELLLGPYSRERSLMPLWHLLALMLSARQEYFMAARACEGAFEQFRDPHVLFGNRHLNGEYRSEHLNEAGIRDEKAGSDGIVDEMDDDEREGILQIKMTQLAILELVEGPSVAVNASTELLTLFPRLFGELEQKLALSPKPDPPKSSAATLRSIRGSVFGSRTDKTAARARQSVATNSDSPTETLTTIPSRPQTTQTVHSVATATLTFQPSNDTAIEPHSGRRSVRSVGIRHRSRNSLRKRDRSVSRQRALSRGEPPVPPLDFAAFEAQNLPQYFSSASRAAAARSVSRPRAGPAGQAEVVAAVVVGGRAGAVAPPLLPYVQFSQDHIRRRRKGVLVKVWLVIAGFYRRAGLLDDAHQAIAEAQKVAQDLEADVVADVSGALSVRQAGWGMEKSVEGVLADVWAEFGHLSLAREMPYQARADFETALTHFPDHPGAIVGLSTILLDIYTQKLLPPPAVPGLDFSMLSLAAEDSASTTDGRSTPLVAHNKQDKFPTLPSTPLGLGPTRPAATSKPTAPGVEAKVNGQSPSTPSPPLAPSLLGPQLPPPHRATSLPLNDRLAARDRAYGLLSGLTKLGSGWDDSEAWFALARAYEESGQVDKARGALWWCVELEDGRAAREWTAVGAGGYVL
ncbi:hypothetical protein BT67DRAFT_415508 [Trichocladium antarcticum]|uniref:Filamentation protein n=1 Tax=Trichocladium antarcticum TaxID=1450529 RepID=A0AAN6ZG03_9PEZI|nr:hypothetical protein BT67DRAFT_415508 [Trichocladium antarcticum]